MLAALAVFGLALHGLPQAGALDTTFNPGDVGYGNGDGAEYVLAMALQPDGRIVISGRHSYNNDYINELTRVDSDGQLDTTFDSESTLPNNSSKAISIQPDGKVLHGGICGWGPSPQYPCTGRKEADGDNDPTFTIPTFVFGFGVYAILLQPDGKALLAGDFLMPYNGSTLRHIVRLNTDGSVDSTFTQGFGPDQEIYAMTLQPDGRILIGGSFTQVNGVPRNRIARLNDDRSLDTSFVPGAGADLAIATMALQANGKVLIGGAFTTYDGIPRTRVARVNSDGSLDFSFDPGSGPDAVVGSIVIQPDDRILIGGALTTYDGVPRPGIVRVEPDGTLDASFTPGEGTNGWVYCMLLQPDGRILIGGTFSMYDGLVRRGITRLNDDGSLDLSFNPPSSANAPLNSLAVQVDGRILLAGNFTGYDGQPRGRITRTEADGSIDPTFMPGTGADHNIHCVVVQPDGRILIAGEFTTYNGMAAMRIARLLPDGSLDPSYNAGNGVSGSIYAMALQPDGKIIIGGAFQASGGLGRIARLNADGTLDYTYNNFLTANGDVRAIDLTPEGRIMIGGSFTEFSGQPHSRIACLDINGYPYPSFNPGTGPNARVRAIEILPDGTALFGGDFTTFNGIPRNHLTKVLPNGLQDFSFLPNNGPNGVVRTILRQPDDRILIGGDFNEYAGVLRSKIARLDPDGGIDLSFDPGTGANEYVSCMALQDDLKILIGGWFTSYNATGRNRVARLYSGMSVGVPEVTTSNVLLWPNPVTTTLHLGQRVDFTVLDNQGRVLRTMSPTDQVSVATLAPGAYFLRTGTGQVYRFIKQ
ncbi:MAG: T9SS type A sorting domain-containing protein [Flavobacteriales bacterium]|nr:T9SS type A sorting domain-containing protein [Flavobacteriales bacterium]